ncbi:hypothetical protein EI94DRAFT_1821064 [Lactarius quietus]|nr:hypothetical protein EI94DRAFT_1821064 [Lactarius quietus]
MHSDEGDAPSPALHPGIEPSEPRSGDRCTLAEEEEEESSDDGDIPSDPGHIQSWSSEGNKTDDDNWHRAAEKEEESSKEDSELVATTQHRAAASDEAGTNWDNDAHPGVGFVKTNVARAENDSHSEEEWWGHAPAPLPSETPTSFLAGHSSPNVDFESEGGVASPAIGTMEKVIDLWNDREALSRAHMKLVDKLSRFDIARTTYHHVYEVSEFGTLTIWL